MDRVPRVTPRFAVRSKELEQSHICLGTTSYSQSHQDRYVSYVLNTLLGGSMSSRLFQNVREKRGLAYAVFSGLSAYRDAGALTIYAGCANEAVSQVIDLTVEELRGIKGTPAPETELRRAKDHLKGSLMLSLENTASRMSHLARQEIYFDRQFGLDETLEGVERVTAEDVQRVAADLFSNGGLAGTVLGPLDGWRYPAARLDLGSEPNRRVRGDLRRAPRAAGRGVTHDCPLHRRGDGPDLERAAAVRDAGCRWRSRRPRRWPTRGSSRPRRPRAIRERGGFDIARIEEIEATTQHDVIAFTTAVAERVGA